MKKFMAVALSLSIHSISQAGQVSTLLQEFLTKNVEVEKLGLQYRLIEIGDQEVNSSKPWTLGLSGNYVDSKLESASPTAYDTLSKGMTLGLTKSFFTGTSISFTSALSQYELTPKAGGSSSDYSEGYQQLSITQNIAKNFFGYSDRLDLAMSQANKSAGAVALNKGTQGQALSFYSALLKVSLYHSMVIYSEEAYQRGVAHSALVKRRVADGLREKVDLYQVEMTQRTLWENVLSTKKSYEEALTELSSMLQRPVGEKEVIDLMKEDIAHRSVQVKNWDQSMDAELLRQELQGLKLGLKKASNALLPTVQLAASLKNNAQDPTQSKALSESTLGGSDREMVLGVNFSWNIGSELESLNKQRANAQLLYKEVEMNSAKKSYQFELEKMQRQLDLIDQQIDSSLEKVKLARQVLTEYTRLYNQGRADLDRLIDAESSLINTQNGHVSYLFSREVLAANLHYVDNSLVQYLEKK